jgi:hypothetical protein
MVDAGQPVDWIEPVQVGVVGAQDTDSGQVRLW